MSKDEDEHTIVSSGGENSERERLVSVRAGHEKVFPKDPFYIKVAKFFFQVISKLIKIAFVGGLLAILAYALYFAFLKARGKDVSTHPFNSLGQETSSVSPSEVYKGSDQTVVYDPDIMKDYGVLRLTSTPVATVILLNGKRMVYPSGKSVSTPIDKILLAPGKHQLTLINPSLDFSRSSTVEIKVGEDKRLDLILKRN